MRNRVTKTLLNSTPHNIKIVFIHFYYVEHLKTLVWMDKNYSKYSKNVSTSYSSMRRVYRASEELVREVARGEF